MGINRIIRKNQVKAKIKEIELKYQKKGSARLLKMFKKVMKESKNVNA